MNNNKARPTLNIEGLTIAYRQRGQWVEVVREVSLQVQPGETYGLVGESGSGKTTLALAVLRYLGQGGRVCQGKIELNGKNLLDLRQSEMRKIWGRQVALLPQNPQSSLNPSLRVGEQIAETLRYNLGLETGQARRKAVDQLRDVNIPDPERVALNYPHQLSGGMQQRVLISMALSSNPALLILDEPTTNLDVTTQAAILDLLRGLVSQRGTAVLYITHNLGVVAQTCQRVGVLYAGVLLEEAPTADLFFKPLHPYTRGLLDSTPRLGDQKDSLRLQPLEGQLPYPGERLSGCIYQPRCPIAIEVCNERPALNLVATGRLTRCHRWETNLKTQESLTPEMVLVNKSRAAESGKQPSVLDLKGVVVHYPVRRTMLQALRGEPRQTVRAVEGIDLELGAGQTLGLVGESGSGKTTLARAILGLVDRTAGRVDLLGVQLSARLSARDLDTLRQVQLVFQNPEEALNPYLKVGQILQRPLVTLLGLSQQGAFEKVPDLLAVVRLPATYAERFPTQLSGGEKQRVAIGRALAANPSLLVCDEPVSALDVSVQASILNLLSDLQADHDNSLLLISHDLAVVGYLADTIAVMYLGQLVEVASTKDLFEPPFHPYTEALLASFPMPDPQAGRGLVPLMGEIPSPMQKPSGCPFHTRCPRFLGEICVQQLPPWQARVGSSKRYRCYIPWEELQADQGAILQRHETG